MKKRFFIFCILVAMICFSCIAINFALDVNGSETTQEEVIEENSEVIEGIEGVEEHEESTEEETNLEDEEPISEDTLSDIEEVFDEEPLSDGEEALTDGEDIIEENIADTENIEEIVDDKSEEIVKNDDVDDASLDEVTISSESECQEEKELDVEYEEVASPSTISIKINWLSNVYLDEAGMGGSYDTNWKTYHVEEDTEFETPDDIIDILNYDNCNQEYKLIGFTTNNQEEKYWLYADYASGEKMYDTSFVACEDIELWAVYEAKYEYVSSITFEEDGIIYNETTIPNLAIKDIVRINNNAIDTVDSEILENYIYKEFGDEIILYTKDAKYGKPLNRFELKIDPNIP